MLFAGFSTVCSLVLRRKSYIALLVVLLRPWPFGFAQATLTAWVVPSLRRISPKQPSESNARVTLWAARGEYESFQIVTHAPDGMDLSNVDVSVSDLTGSDGRVIPASNLTLYREYYVCIPPNGASPDWHGTNRPTGSGCYPDALIPLGNEQIKTRLPGGGGPALPYALRAGTNQPIWVDIFVPRDAVAGPYTGSFRITSDQGGFDGQILLNVWDFILPPRPFLHSSFGVWDASKYPIDVELLRNRIAPDGVELSAQASFMRDYGLALTGLGFSSGAKYGDCNMRPSPSQSSVRQAAGLQQPGLMLYDYSADEVDDCKNLVPAMKDWARALHAAGVKNLVPMGPVPSLFDDGSGTGRSAVDIWAVLPVTIDSDSQNVQAAIRKGDEVWSYNTEVQDAYSPKWEIDFEPINFRIQPGFINQSLGLSGLLYWRVDRWSTDSWNNVIFHDGSGAFPGEGQLVYPGAPIGIPGVVPSMRLKWLRDGVDDYDYIQLLKQAGYAEWAMEIAQRVGPDWKNWTRDPSILEAARLQFGTMLSSLNSSGHGVAPIRHAKNQSPVLPPKKGT